MPTFFLATFWITLAEMGDKTQLLAMAFATRYRAWQVLVGVFVATVLNHALAVLAGSMLVRIPGAAAWVQLLAAVSFIGFGLWTIHGDHLEGEDRRPTRHGAIATVAIAFFIAEIGDKTQLTTISLAAEYPGQALAVLAGTTTGMLIADAFGIIVGVVMHKHIPERLVKALGATVFILFGLLKTWQVLTTDTPDQGFNWHHGHAGLAIALLAIGTLAAVRQLTLPAAKKAPAAALPTTKSGQ